MFEDNEQLRIVIRRCLRAKVTLRPLEDGWRKMVIEEALAECNGNVCAAALLLGKHRNTVSRNIDELEIDIKRFCPPGTRNRWMVLNQFAKKKKTEATA